jgi:hypothetical protein
MGSAAVPRDPMKRLEHLLKPSLLSVQLCICSHSLIPASGLFFNLLSLFARDNLTFSGIMNIYIIIYGMKS